MQKQWDISPSSSFQQFVVMTSPACSALIPFFWSCICSTWIIKALVRQTSFICGFEEWVGGVYQARNNISYWSDRIRDWTPTSDSSSSLAYFNFQAFTLLIFLFHTHFSVRFAHMLTRRSCLWFSLLPLISLPPSPHILSAACALIFFFLSSFNPHIYFTTLIESQMIQNPHLPSMPSNTNICSDYI